MFHSSLLGRSFVLETYLIQLNLPVESHHSKVVIVSSLALFLFSSFLGGPGPACASNLMQDFDIVWGNDHVKLLNNGEVMSLSLDKVSGSGFRSKNQYLFGKIDMQIKMVPGNSAGTVTSYYMKSEGSLWDEIDFEFLGNLSGDPYLIHTNVYTQGKGDREQQFYPWFDPTADFHTYSILWNPQAIIFSVDGVPIREYKNLEARGVPFPKNQPMKLQSTLWNADDWATRGGLVKTDWSKAPFVASYRNFNAQACVVLSPSGQSSCGAGRGGHVPPPWFNQQLDGQSRQRMRWVRQKYMVYNYCTDTKRFPNGFPPECAID